MDLLFLRSMSPLPPATSENPPLRRIALYHGRWLARIDGLFRRISHGILPAASCVMLASGESEEPSL